MFNKNMFNKNKYKKIKVFKFYSYNDNNIVDDYNLDTFLKENDVININTSHNTDCTFISVVYWANK